MRVRIRSRATSAKPPSTAIMSHPVLTLMTAHSSPNERNALLAATVRFTMPNRSKVLQASRSKHVTVSTVARGKAADKLKEFTAVDVRAVTFSR